MRLFFSTAIEAGILGASIVLIANGGNVIAYSLIIAGCLFTLWANYDRVRLAERTRQRLERANERMYRTVEKLR